MKYCFDIDGTLCTNTNGNYEEAKPIQHVIDSVRALYTSGHTIILFTARGTTTGIDWGELTIKQMESWMVPYHVLKFGKPEADVYVDDKGLSIQEWGKSLLNHSSVGTSIRSRPAMERSEYLDVVYSYSRRPKSNYPDCLADYLKKQFVPNGGNLLDAGCGRGDMLHAFARAGFEVTGCDISPAVGDYCAPHPSTCVNLTTEDLPFQQASFDVVFSKSVIEHIQDPMKMLASAFDALRPGGKLILLTPSWRHTAFGSFYIDYTHITPYTQPSLRDVIQLAGFENIAITHFRQLPFLWMYPWLDPLVSILAHLPLRYEPLDQMNFKWPSGINKLIRFSKEVMLLAIAEKPITTL